MSQKGQLISLALNIGEDGSSAEAGIIRRLAYSSANWPMLTIQLEPYLELLAKYL